MVPHVIAHLVRRHILVHRGHKNLASQHKLILHRKTIAFSLLGIFQKHGPHHGKSFVFVSRIQIGGRGRAGVEIRHQPGFLFHVHTVNPCIRIAKGKGSFHIASPAVHVQHLRGEGFPLIIPGLNQRLSPENTVHIAADIGIPGQRASDISGDMETDILPVSPGLVSRPHTVKPLGAGPAVQGNQVRAKSFQGSHKIIGGFYPV